MDVPDPKHHYNERNDNDRAEDPACNPFPPFHSATIARVALPSPWAHPFAAASPFWGARKPIGYRARLEGHFLALEFGS